MEWEQEVYRFGLVILSVLTIVRVIVYDVRDLQEMWDSRRKTTSGSEQLEQAPKREALHPPGE